MRLERTTKKLRPNATPERSIGDPTAEELYKGGDYKKSRMAAYDKKHSRARSSTLRKRKARLTAKGLRTRPTTIRCRGQRRPRFLRHRDGRGNQGKHSLQRSATEFQKAYEDGKISLARYKNELLLLGEAAKSGTTSMGDLAQIQRRINLDMVGAKSDADKSLSDQYAGGVKTKR